jgi:hypothetical protein
VNKGRYGRKPVNPRYIYKYGSSRTLVLAVSLAASLIGAKSLALDIATHDPGK